MTTLFKHDAHNNLFEFESHLFLIVEILFSQNKKSESDIRVQSRIVEAFQLLNQRKIVESLKIFQEILALPNTQVSE